MKNNIEIVILAAGKGTRMYSDIPKVLHKIAGKTMLQHVIDKSREISENPIHLIYGHGGDKLKSDIHGNDLVWTEQVEQLGTGHAVKQIINKVNPDNDILILYADVPLITIESLLKLKEQKQNKKLAILTTILKDPTGYGRIIRNNNKVIKITEEKDASTNEKLIDEVNTGIMLVSAHKLIDWVNNIDNKNAQKEYYLTDIVEFSINDKEEISTYITHDADEVSGVNNRTQLAYLERRYQRIQAEKVMAKGTTIIDPDRFDLRGSLEIGKDVIVDINVIFEGKCNIGNNVLIGANNIIKNSTIGDNTIIHENCHIENSTISKGCQIGPYARLRPETELSNNVKVGNFVEIKKSIINESSKVNHLSYIGDTEMGKNVNVGAGTITCNYDGANKHKTTIGDDVFIGSNSAIVAPVELNNTCTIGAGSTITKSVKENELALTRAKQLTVKSWKRPIKKV